MQANDPLAHTYSQNAAVSDFTSYFGTVIAGSSAVNTMMSAEPHPFCTDAWDCNNRDKQDWKREADYYYALYNGANYYRCNGAWGISVARSSTPVGPEYTDRLPIDQGIKALRDDTCGISYPYLNVSGDSRGRAAAATVAAIVLVVIGERPPWAGSSLMVCVALDGSGRRWRTVHLLRPSVPQRPKLAHASSHRACVSVTQTRSTGTPSSTPQNDTNLAFFVRR